MHMLYEVAQNIAQITNFTQLNFFLTLKMFTWHKRPVYEITVAPSMRPPATLLKRLRNMKKKLTRSLNMFLDIQGFPHQNITWSRNM